MRLRYITTFALLLLCGQLQAQTTILFEDFEDATVGYVTNFADDLGVVGGSAPFNDYHGRFASDTTPTTPGTTTYGNLQGTGLFAVQDKNSSPVTPATTDLTMTWTGVSTGGLTGLNLSWYVAEDEDPGLQDWEASDMFRIEVDSGSGFATVFEVAGTAANSEPEVTIGVGLTTGSVGDKITDTFTQYAVALATVATLDIRVTFIGLNSQEEDIAFDSLLLVGVVPEPSTFAFLLLFGSSVGLRRRRRRS